VVGAVVVGTARDRGGQMIGIVISHDNHIGAGLARAVWAVWT